MTEAEKYFDEITRKGHLIDAIIYGTCQGMMDFYPEIEFVDNDYVIGYIQNSDEELLVEYCEMEGFDVTEDEVIDFMVDIVSKAKPFKVRVEDIDEC